MGLFEPMFGPKRETITYEEALLIVVQNAMIDGATVSDTVVAAGGTKVDALKAIKGRAAIHLPDIKKYARGYL